MLASLTHPRDVQWRRGEAIGGSNRGWTGTALAEQLRIWEASL